LKIRKIGLHIYFMYKIIAIQYLPENFSFQRHYKEYGYAMAEQKPPILIVLYLCWEFEHISKINLIIQRSFKNILKLKTLVAFIQISKTIGF